MKEENIDVKVVNKQDFKTKYWAPFRVPTGTDQVVLDTPWVFPWLREKGKKKFWKDLRFKGKVKKIPVNIKDKENKYIVTATMPNLSKEDITIEAADKNLVLIGNSGADENSKYARAIKFKDNIKPDQTKACYKDNDLKVTIPKKAKVVETAGKKIKTNK